MSKAKKAASLAATLTDVRSDDSDSDVMEDIEEPQKGRDSKRKRSLNEDSDDEDVESEEEKEEETNGDEEDVNGEEEDDGEEEGDKDNDKKDVEDKDVTAESEEEEVLVKKETKKTESKEEAPQKKKKNRRPKKKHKSEVLESEGRQILFVGQLPYDVTVEQIKEHFAKHGAGDIAVRMLTDKNTGKSKGMAFIDVATEEAAAKALAVHHSKLSGRRINVEKSSISGEKGKREKEVKETKKETEKERQKILDGLITKVISRSKGRIARNIFDEDCMKFLKTVPTSTAKEALMDFSNQTEPNKLNSAYLMGIIKRCHTQTDTQNTEPLAYVGANKKKAQAESGRGRGGMRGGRGGSSDRGAGFGGRGSFRGTSRGRGGDRMGSRGGSRGAYQGPVRGGRGGMRGRGDGPMRGGRGGFARDSAPESDGAKDDWSQTRGFKKKTFDD
eukprot:Colp12_sorted_trinity150504_noHs@18500